MGEDADYAIAMALAADDGDLAMAVALAEDEDDVEGDFQIGDSRSLRLKQARGIAQFKTQRRQANANPRRRKQPTKSGCKGGEDTVVDLPPPPPPPPPSKHLKTVDGNCKAVRSEPCTSSSSGDVEREIRGKIGSSDSCPNNNHKHSKEIRRLSLRSEGLGKEHKNASHRALLQRQMSTAGIAEARANCPPSPSPPPPPPPSPPPPPLHCHVAQLEPIEDADTWLAGRLSQIAGAEAGIQPVQEEKDVPLEEEEKADRGRGGNEWLGSHGRGAVGERRSTAVSRQETEGSTDRAADAVEIGDAGGSVRRALPHDRTVADHSLRILGKNQSSSGALAFEAAMAVCMEEEEEEEKSKEAADEDQDHLDLIPEEMVYEDRWLDDGHVEEEGSGGDYVAGRDEEGAKQDEEKVNNRDAYMDGRDEEGGAKKNDEEEENGEHYMNRGNEEEAEAGEEECQVLWCPVCGMDMGFLTTDERQAHGNECLDKLEQPGRVAPGKRQEIVTTAMLVAGKGNGIASTTVEPLPMLPPPERRRQITDFFVCKEGGPARGTAPAKSSRQEKGKGVVPLMTDKKGGQNGLHNKKGGAFGRHPMYAPVDRAAPPWVVVPGTEFRVYQLNV
ncbi:hypothetical protein CBR_g54202 [Chara braunii]|uniref:Uncharacterized protein n=1 Tax=Chara braunii TaxID=69332 RepID=A0A388K776_CHABU|nr:hypothetical protein CBR_g54202 [Chara braunii]|eukprot:GBG65910.1 hypothetical protein CBR_g54202 [Chara braunii]